MIISVFIPVIVVFMMIIVGSGLQISQLKSILQAPKIILVSTLAQIVFLPLTAVGLIYLLDLPAELAVGLLLISAAPGGGLSNFYCYLGRLDVPLSVILTAISSIFSFITLPLILEFTLHFVSSSADFFIPVSILIKKLLFILLLPIAIGMLIRYYFFELIEKKTLIVRAFSLVLLLMLLLLIVIDQWHIIKDIYRDAVLITLLFTGIAMSIAWLTAYVLKLPKDKQIVLSIEFAIRNVGITALIAASILGRPEFVAFGALFVVFQFPVMSALIYYSRR